MKSDRKTKLIEECEVTRASVRESQAIENFLIERDEGHAFYADSAYGGKDQKKIYKKKNIINKVHGKRN